MEDKWNELVSLLPGLHFWKQKVEAYSASCSIP